MVSLRGVPPGVVRRRDVRREVPRLAELAAPGDPLLEGGVELVDGERERREALRLDPGPRAEGVVAGERVGEALPDRDDDVALPAEEVADRDADDDEDQREVEDEVARLLEVAALGAERAPVVGVHPEPLAAQHLSRSLQRLLGGRRDLGLGVRGQPLQPARGPGRLRAHGPPVHARAGQHAPDERDEQQQVDRGEPRRGVDLEEAEAVQPGPERRVLRDVVGGAGCVDAPLRPDRARHRTDREQQEEEQRRAHARQLPPGEAQQAERPELGLGDVSHA